MTTAQFQHMRLNPHERTPILIRPAAVVAYCWRCHRDVLPNTIITAFVARPLDYCPRCHSVIQKDNNDGTTRSN